MPIYEYACKKCNAKFEQLVRAMSASDEGEKVKCPECGSMQTARAMSVFAVGSEAPKRSAALGPCAGCCGGADGSCPMRE